MKKVIIVLILILSIINAKTYEELVQEMDKDYDTFITKMDKDFAKALGKDWKEFDSEFEPSFSNPKPRTTPVAPKAPKKEVDNTPRAVINTVPQPPYYRNPTLPNIPSPTRGYKKLSINFFSQKIDIVYNEKLNYKLREFDNNSIAQYWLHQSNIEINNLLNQIREHQRALNLNDWHIYLLVKDIAKKITHDRENSRLLSWFILNKLGYDVKLGFDKNNSSIYLMPNINQQIYNALYTKINNQTYYSFDNSHRKNIYTYPSRFANTRPLNLAKNTTPYLNRNIKTYKLNFKNRGMIYSISVPYNKNLITLYNSYPSMDWNYYFRQPIEPITKYKLFNQLKSIMQNMSELEAVNFLLHLTQYSFKYATDNEQFGRERTLFLEESLGYRANDCEDRSVFFGKLVKELLGLPIVALHYPNHLAIAVAFKSDVKGESFLYNNRKYTVCDPTYIGADVGLAMPQFRGSKNVKIIPINY